MCGKVKVRKLDMATTMTVNVTVTKEFKVRMKIATLFVTLAGWVLGCGIKVNTEPV